MKTVTAEQAREKIRHYCAYQERSHLEVRNKLYEYGIRRDDVDEIISTLVTDGYLNEERFAKAFAGGKFRVKKWGRIKITRGLEGKGVSPNCVRIGLQEIDEQSYVDTLRTILSVKATSLNHDNVYVLRDRIATYAIQKGYEPDLVWAAVNELVPNKS
jgi:regulatory protein